MLQIGICDDETVIAARMEELIFETCRAEGIQAGVEVFYSGNTLLEEVRRGTRYDLLYLDIHMQKGNGISAAEQIRKLDDNVLLIFVSGYDQYLMELFRLDVFEFVKKPFEKESFVQTFLRAVRKVGEKSHYFVYAYRGEEFKLPCMEILFFESRGRKIWIHMKNGETAFFNGKLSDVEEKLRGGKVPFLRIHQSYLVNYHFIRSRNRSEVRLLNHIVLPIAEDRRKDFGREYGRLLGGEIDV